LMEGRTQDWLNQKKRVPDGPPLQKGSIERT
jgi:hypothetical protein